jgi:LmbE family N-acetylglucosaminyl deacetylase
MKISILLPHMDDEVFIIPYLVEVKSLSYDQVSIYYLTKSEGRNLRFSQEIREKESLQMVKSILPSADVEFLGRKYNVGDQHLHESLSEIFKYLEEQLENNCDVLISTHFEGGHIDHDSAGILTGQLAKSLGCNFFTFNLYSARQKNSSLYRVAKSTEWSLEQKKIKIRLPVYFHSLLIPYIYKSQIRTWVGIYPPLIWRFLVRRKSHLNVSPEFNPFSKPNNGRVLYENRFDGRYDQWVSKIEEFVIFTSNY